MGHQHSNGLCGKRKFYGINLWISLQRAEQSLYVWHSHRPTKTREWICTVGVTLWPHSWVVVSQWSGHEVYNFSLGCAIRGWTYYLPCPPFSYCLFGGFPTKQTIFWSWKKSNPISSLFFSFDIGSQDLVGCVLPSLPWWHAWSDQNHI